MFTTKPILLLNFLVCDQFGVKQLFLHPRRPNSISKFFKFDQSNSVALYLVATVDYNGIWMGANCSEMEV